MQVPHAQLANFNSLRAFSVIYLCKSQHACFIKIKGHEKNKI
jgi:hypothetical protein